MLGANARPRHARVGAIQGRNAAFIATAVSLSLALASCGGGAPTARGPSVAAVSPATFTGRTKSVTAPLFRRTRSVAALTALPKPTDLAPFAGRRVAGEGVWQAAGRRVDGVPAVFETRLVLPGEAQPVGIAWMDTRLLAARLYSGSVSPGGGPYRYTAPIQPASARHLVAAFNGGFKMDSAQGGYYTEGRMIDPLRPGAASLVIDANGSVDIGAWGSDMSMTPQVVAVRQNLVPLIADGRPTPLAESADWQAWGNTCGASSCAASVAGIEHQWRSAVGVTSDGALVYAQGPALAPLQLAELLVRAGVVRGMELDINPDWPVLATYHPANPHGLAAPSNGHLLTATVRGPDTFFDASWARDFITMSAR